MSLSDLLHRLEVDASFLTGIGERRQWIDTADQDLGKVCDALRKLADNAYTLRSFYSDEISRRIERYKDSFNS